MADKTCTNCRYRYIDLETRNRKRCYWCGLGKPWQFWLFKEKLASANAEFENFKNGFNDQVKATDVLEAETAAPQPERMVTKNEMLHLIDRATKRVIVDHKAHGTICQCDQCQSTVHHDSKTAAPDAVIRCPRCHLPYSSTERHAVLCSCLSRGDAMSLSNTSETTPASDLKEMEVGKAGDGKLHLVPNAATKQLLLGDALCTCGHTMDDHKHFSGSFYFGSCTAKKCRPRCKHFKKRGDM